MHSKISHNSSTNPSMIVNHDKDKGKANDGDHEHVFPFYRAVLIATYNGIIMSLVIYLRIYINIYIYIYIYMACHTVSIIHVFILSSFFGIFQQFYQ